jgi:hypothetical protein
MKRTTLSGLFITAALLASPVFAAEDLCDVNLTKIKNEQATTTAANQSQTDDISTALKSAEAAKASGDTKDCIAQTGKILSDLEKSKKGGGAGK